MSDLENLKKQAKQVLRWHKERHWPIAEELRLTLDSFRDLTDREILDRPFKLADAQQYVALRAGYESWADLKSHAADLADEPEEAVRLTSALPNLCVADIDRSMSFYIDKMGFTVDFKYGEPPFYGHIKRDELCLALRSVDGYILEALSTRRREEQLLTVMFKVTGIKRLYQQLLENGVPMFQTLRTEPWGLKGFIAEDPDGHLLSFSEQAAEE